MSGLLLAAVPGFESAARPSSSLANRISDVAQARTARAHPLASWSTEASVIYEFRGDDCEVRATRSPSRTQVDTWAEAYRTLVDPELLDAFDDAPEPETETLAASLPGQPRALGRVSGDWTDIAVGGVAVLGGDGRISVVRPSLLGIRTFHCMPQVETEATDDPQRWANVQVVHPRAEGYDGEKECDPLLDDECMVGCFDHSKSQLDSFVDAGSGQPPLLIERREDYDGEEVEPSESEDRVQLHVDGAQLVIRGCGDEVRLQWP